MHSKKNANRTSDNSHVFLDQRKALGAVQPRQALEGLKIKAYFAFSASLKRLEGLGPEA